MKRTLGKETTLLLLPVLLLGGAAWWQRSREQRGHFGFPNPFASGPIRIECSPFEEQEVTAFDVSRGYEWKGRVDLQIRGNTGLPRSLHLDDYSFEGAELQNVVLEYRRDGVWKKSPDRGAVHKEGEWTKEWDIAPQTLFVDLKSVPADAREVRIRGRFMTIRDFEGRIPAGSKLPKNFKVSSLTKALTITSDLFEVIVKAPHEAMPAPVVSRRPRLQFVNAKWLYDTNTYAPSFDILAVRFRDISGRDIFASSPALKMTAFGMWDADGKPINLYTHGYTDPFSPGLWSCEMLDRQSYFPNMPKEEAIFRLFDYVEPQRDWKSLKQPVEVKFMISDGESWPITVRAKLKRRGYRSLKNLALGE
jgi:hypothetical protein